LSTRENETTYLESTGILELAMAARAGEKAVALTHDSDGLNVSGALDVEEDLPDDTDIGVGVRPNQSLASVASVGQVNPSETRDAERKGRRTQRLDLEVGLKRQSRA
jgi:hypothetical protein